MAQGLVFQGVVDAHSPFRAVAEERPDQVSLMVHGHGDVVEAVSRELADDDFQDRVVADGHQEFGQDDRVGAQARASSARQDDGALLHTLYSSALYRARLPGSENHSTVLATPRLKPSRPA